MFHSLTDDILYLTVCQRIVYRLAISAVFYQLHLLQHPKLMGNGRLRHAQCLCEITDTHLRL